SVAGSVSSDVTVGGKVVIPKGSSAKLVVASAQASGHLSTPAKLWLRLRSVTVNGKTYALTTSLAGRTAGSKAKRDTVFIGGGAGAGALIGGLAGGGKSAGDRAPAGGRGRPARAAGAGEKNTEVCPPDPRLLPDNRGTADTH